ncbi:LPD38 domain-containing protein [Cytobacillus sp. FSL R5-0596]|uniref:LPD38 domain-containing protein n=1 Tax=Cytobacillus sp. FSL R5-0596 TaxID=2954696 RepID=UPI0030FBF527
MAWNEDKYKKIFESRYGSGSFESGLSNARTIGENKARAEYAKQLFNQRKKEVEKAAKPSYDDAVSYWNQPENKEMLRKDGANRNAENIRNDPRLKAQIKAQGFSVDEYIDAMYNASSDGKFRSEREFKKFAGAQQKEANKKPTTQDLIAKYSKQSTAEASVEKKEKKDNDGGPSLLKDIFTPLKRFGQAINPFDDVSIKEAIQGNVDDALKTERSPVTKEATRGLTRIANTGTLGALDQIYKKTNDGERAAQFTNEDRGTAGKVADFGYDALGYLIPGVGAYGAVRGAGLGVKSGSQGLTKLRQLAQEGAITGAGIGAAEVGVREGLNPGDTTAADNLKHIALGGALGAVADPALYGAGKVAGNALARFAKGDVPTYSGNVSNDVLERLRPPTRNNAVQSNTLYDQLSQSAVPAGRMLPEDQLAMANRERQSEVGTYNQEFDEAVEQQFQYLKNSMGKGTQPGGLVRDQEGYVTGAYGRVSNNPKWYQDFYADNGRRPTNAELRELAEIQVREGFEDEVGSIAPWQPKEVQSIQDEIDDLARMIEIEPQQEQALRPILEALEQDKAEVMSRYENITSTPVAATSEPSLARIQAPSKPQPNLERLRAGRDFEPIESAIPDDGGRLIRAEPIDRTPVDIQNPKEIVKRQINKDGKREKSKWSFDKAYTAWVDDLFPLEKATKQLGKNNLKIDEDPYKMARLARGVSGKAETYLQGGVYDANGQKVGASLKEIIKPIENKLDDFLAYSTSKRAMDYDKKGLTAGIKPKDVEGFNDYQLAEATIRQIEAESPEIKAVHEELLKYNNRLMDDLVDAGVLSKESVETIRTENPNYIPMFRVQDKKVRGFEPLTNPKRTYANLGDPVKKRTGSEREIVNPIESIVKNTYLMLNMAERNKVGRSLLDLAEQADNTNNPWVRVVKQDKGLSVDDIGRSLDEANAQLNDGNADAVDNLFKGEGNKVYVYRDGQRVELELQEDLYKAMLSLDTQKQNFFIKMLSVPTRMLRTGAVLSPDFGPVNIFRDQLSALINSQYGFIPFVDMARGMKSVLKKDDIYHSWKNSGGANSVLSTLDREYLQQDIRKLVKQSLSEQVKTNFGSPKKVLDSMLEPLRKVSEITEESTRLGEFKKGLKKGATPQEAAFASRDLIDFNKAGTHGRQYNQVTAFFNAAVQSMDKLARTFKEKPAQSTVKAMMGITLPSVVAYYYNKDKEWYKEIPQRERDLYWHFEIGEQVYKLPKPFEAGIIFGTSFERMLDYMETEDPASFEEFGKTLMGAFTPSWIPTAIQPWIEVYANNSIHFDSPIVPRREQDMLPEDQYGPYQSELSKGLGKLMKKSPRKVEHVFKGYTGGLGKYALQFSDVAAKGAGVTKPDLPDRGLADKPIVNRFVVKNLEGNNQSVNDFYKKMDKLKRENLSAKKNNPDHENSEGYKAFNQLSREISELQKMKRAIIDDPNMDGKQKADEIRKIDLTITELAKIGVKIPN